jgi:hypothetical protein
MMNQERIIKTIMKKTTLLAVIMVATCCFVSTSHASGEKQPEVHNTGKGFELHLSHDLNGLLNQEMNELESGMTKIITAISAGNWDTIIQIAKKIKNSFILKQKITPKQMEELHSSLPKEFIAMDRDFHLTAGKLAHAAFAHDGELVNFYFYKLYEQCTKCHSQYALERFPNFKSVQQGKGEQH